jgi:hypothetical protein
METAPLVPPGRDTDGFGWQSLTFSLLLRTECRVLLLQLQLKAT